MSRIKEYVMFGFIGSIPNRILRKPIDTVQRLQYFIDELIDICDRGKGVKIILAAWKEDHIEFTDGLRISGELLDQINNIEYD